MGRSGSTLLRQMLDMHPSIIAPPESFFVLHLMDKYGKVKDWTREIKDNFITDLYTDRPFRLIWNIPIETVQDALVKAPSNMSFIEVSNIVRSCYDPKKGEEGKKVFIDKNPIYSILYKKLISAHPLAKVIHLVRDPRGVINGHMHTFKRKDIFALGHLWNTRNTKIEIISKALNIKYFRVRFEDLVDKPEQTIISLCEFLEVEYSEKIMQYNNRVEKFFSKQTKHYTNKHTSTQKPLSKSISEKWKKNLTEKQLEKISFMTSSFAKKYGYSIQDKEPNLLYSLSLNVSKLKLKFMLTLVHIYFNLPFFMRKSILSLRSKVFDHKYKK